jgi:hypothetical protein
VRGNSFSVCQNTDSAVLEDADRMRGISVSRSVTNSECP